jgi:hypothetical protein
MMSIPYYNPEQGVPDAASGARRGEFNTLSSKMFDTYLTDIEQLLHHQMWSAALTDALALPHIAVALERRTATQFRCALQGMVRNMDSPRCGNGRRCSSRWCTAFRDVVRARGRR